MFPTFWKSVEEIKVQVRVPLTFDEPETCPRLHVDKLEGLRCVATGATRRHAVDATVDRPPERLRTSREAYTVHVRCWRGQRAAETRLARVIPAAPRGCGRRGP